MKWRSLVLTILQGLRSGAITRCLVSGADIDPLVLVTRVELFIVFAKTTYLWKSIELQPITTIEARREYG